MPSAQHQAPLPPDQPQRDQILRDLDTSLLVEAAAGTGKTTSMVGRMVGLLAEGKCRIETLAAVTFTRKSAAELRARFQLALERAARDEPGPAGRRLAEALAHVERAFIGTIHAFCGRLLRERPVEAGVNPAFRELDEDEDALLREEAWSQYVAGLHARDDATLARLNELDLEIGSLKDAFLTFCEFSDVDEWPAPDTPLEGLEQLRKEVADYVAHMQSLVPTFPAQRGNDTLMNAYERVVRIARQTDLGCDAELMRLLEAFGSARVVQKEWPGKKPQAQAEEQRWGAFLERVCRPWLARWWEHRYPAVIQVLQAAGEVYHRLRGEAGGLNFQDLLLKAARLLRRQPAIREYFRRRYTHLLVDEFQDTDPIQAQVLLYLTATDPRQQNWRLCRPAPGSLFVVGDPKQSIYRFRRADIEIYNEVKQIIERHGRVLSLSTNFRTIPQLVEWGNDLFDRCFSKPGDSDYHERSRYGPQPCRMAAGRAGGAEGDLQGLRVLRVPDDASNKDAAVAYDAGLVARTIRYALDTGATVPRPGASGGSPAQPGDFLIVAYKKKFLAEYARELAALGIPHQVTGGTALGQVSELRLLADCLQAVAQPDNPLALVAVLRGELFGASDTALYAFRRAGGTFHYRTDVPPELPEEDALPLREAFDKLRAYALWLRSLPPVAALERMAADLGLPMRAAAQPGGNVRAGSLAKALELLRQEQAQRPSTAELADYLHELIAAGGEFDGLPARPPDAPAVRIMNLHKVKGLEAPVVFLAAPAGKFEHPITRHIDRQGDAVHGYLQVTVPKGDFQHQVLARPAGWEACDAEETRHRDAERVRLMYVAATRAGAQLVISQRAKNNNKNDWSFFENELQGVAELPDPGPQAPPAGPEIEVAPADAAAAAAAADVRRSAAARPSYGSQAAKKLAQAAAPPAPSASPRAADAPDGEHGTEWGTVIHLLLQTRMAQPQADLHGLARDALEHNGLDPAWADQAVDVVGRVVGSAVWQRACAAPQRLVEVPFTKLLPASSPWVRNGLPTLVRGVIDLVFREAAGWVIVDYKTDQAARTALPAVVEHHRPQVQMYGQLWEEMVGEPVVERGLYFTEVDRYVKL